MEDDYFFCKWKTTIFLVNGRCLFFLVDDLIFLKMEDDLNSFENGRQPQFIENGRQLICLGKWKTTIFFVNGRRLFFW
jgi:sRNA-binding regulator protein Hfq